MVLGDALDEEEVVAVYGSLETGGWVDHCMVIDIRLYCSQSRRKSQIVVEIHILFSRECIMIELDGRNLVHADYGVLPSCPMSGAKYDHQPLIFTRYAFRLTILYSDK